MKKRFIKKSRYPFNSHISLTPSPYPLSYNPLVTLVLPIYNVEKYLDTSFKSATEQTYKNIEILAIDDGSTDNSGKIADMWALSDNRIRVIHQKNGGLSKARNTGIENAHGECIYFFDSDDVIETTLVEDCLQALRHYEADIVSFKFDTIGEEGGLIPSRYAHNYFFNIQTLTPVEAIKKQLKSRIGGYAWAYFSKTILFRENNITFPLNRKVEDLARICTILGSASRIVRIPKVLYHYRVRAHSIMTQTTALLPDWSSALKDRFSYIEDSYPQLKRYAFIEQFDPTTLDYETIRQALLTILKIDYQTAQNRKKKRELKRQLKNSSRHTCT